MPPATSPSDPSAHLLALPTIRSRTSLLLPALQSNTLRHFTISLPAFHARVVPAVVQTIRSYVGTNPYSAIPPHGRWQHFDVGGEKRLDALLDAWDVDGVDQTEKVRRVIDLTLVSVLLDAGAGNAWRFTELSGESYGRSEGLAVASLRMFERGLFSSDPAGQPCRVDAEGLAGMTVPKLAAGLQVTETNPIAGLEGRAGLLRDLGAALKNEQYFGAAQRPGGMLDYLLPDSSSAMDERPVLEVTRLWKVLTHGLGSIWPARTTVNGHNVGDAWRYSWLASDTPGNDLAGTDGADVVPFHKLTQWLTYSLLIPFKRLLGCDVRGEELLTGLPEYRNGGFFVDYGALTLRPQVMQRGLEAARQAQGGDGGEDGKGKEDKSELVPLFAASDDVIIEWRAVTVCLLDMLLPEVNKTLGLGLVGSGEVGGNVDQGSGVDLSNTETGQNTQPLTLAQMLEAGSWPPAAKSPHACVRRARDRRLGL